MDPKQVIEKMDQEKFKVFSKAYRAGLEEAVTASPSDYFSQGATPSQYAEVVSKKMMGNIAAGRPFSNNYEGQGFKRACKKVGIKHTRKAILEFMGICD